MNSHNLQLLGEYYRRKRESILPETVGLNKSGRKSRTPGLRREDVAYLANLSPVWYSKIERGKTQGISSAAIQALNAALQLTDTEKQYVDKLLHSDATSSSRPPCMTLAFDTQHLLDQINPLPALVMNDYLDIIYANSAFIQMSGLDINTYPPEERNYLYLSLTSPVWQQFLNATNIASLDETLTRHAGILRSNQAARPTDQRMINLINYFISLSPLFAKAWQRNTINKPLTEYPLWHAALNETIVFHKQIWHNGNGESSGKISVYHPIQPDAFARIAELAQ